MSRTLSLIALTAAAGLLATPLAAADWSTEGFRTGYPADWESSDDTLNFDIGVRYWYALGSQSLGVAANGDFTQQDQSHLVEGHFRIEDDATSSYVSGMAGFAARIDGTYTNPGVVEAPLAGGQVAYAQGDFGWMPLGSSNARFGAVIGYQYWNDSPDAGRANFTTPQGVDSEPNNFNVHSLRLGLTTKIDFNEMFDITAEAVAVPYGWATGTFGALGITNTVINGETYQQSSAATINGNVWGGQAQVLFGFKPTENLAIRVGGRAWYLTGPVEGTYSMANVNDPTDSFNVIGELENFSLWRYGAVAEVSYSF